MSNTPFRALVVDDEAIARRMVMTALTREGFLCDPSIDGIDALDRMEDTDYDLIVTDLRMPNKHGHALSVELLARGRVPAPVLAIHTNVDDPRMTKDLMLRGVDDIVYKPTNYAAFAAKMKALVGRRKAEHATASTWGQFAAGLPADLPRVGARPDERAFYASIGVEEFDKRLAQIGHILPVSDVAIEVLDRVRADDSDASALAELIAGDGVLAAELLRLANNGFYNRSGRQITSLNEAIALVGTKRIGEISLAVSALGSLTNTVLPWFDKDLARRRSLAGCMAANRVLECHGPSVSGQGVVFSSLMYPLGRIVVGTAYANVYDTLVAECQRTALPLRVLERDVIPRSPSAATAQVLSRWGLPADICAPLIHADATFESLVTLTEPLRTSVKLLKTAIVLGEFAVRRWMPWDAIEFPSDDLLGELGINSAREIIDDVCRDLDSLGSTRPDEHNVAGDPGVELAEPAPKRIVYCSLSAETFDIVPLLSASMNFELDHVSRGERDLGQDVVVNCLHAPPTRLSARRGETGSQNWVVMANESLPDSFRRFATVIRLPASYRAIQSAFEQVAAEQDDQSPGSALGGYTGTLPEPSRCLDINA